MKTDRLVQSEGRFVSDVPRQLGVDDWSHWCTFTFTQGVAERAAQNAVRSLLKRCVWQVGEHIAYASVIAPQPGSGIPHAHLLLGIDPRDQLPDDVVRDLWGRSHRHAGSAVVEPFEPGGQAPWYLIKHGYDWEVNVLCPRAAACRRPGLGCRRAPGPLAI